MSANATLLKLFPEAAGTHSKEDGIGTYHDRHATSVVDRNAAARKAARVKKLKKLSKKKARSRSRRPARAGTTPRPRSSGSRTARTGRRTAAPACSEFPPAVPTRHSMEVTMKGLASITLATDGVPVRPVKDVFASAKWWVVRVRDAACPSGLWCVYGGPPATVLACLKEFSQYNTLTDAVAYPFDDATESMVRRNEIEQKYMTPGRLKVAA